MNYIHFDFKYCPSPQWTLSKLMSVSLHHLFSYLSFYFQLSSLTRLLYFIYASHLQFLISHSLCTPPDSSTTVSSSPFHTSSCCNTCSVAAWSSLIVLLSIERWGNRKPLSRQQPLWVLYTFDWQFSTSIWSYHYHPHLK
jgi:hypothetical protein